MLSNRKPEHRQGKVQLIDATQRFKPLRKNRGKKNWTRFGPLMGRPLAPRFARGSEAKAV